EPATVAISCFFSAVLPDTGVAARPRTGRVADSLHRIGYLLAEERIGKAGVPNERLDDHGLIAKVLQLLVCVDHRALLDVRSRRSNPHLCESPAAPASRPTTTPLAVPQR